MRSFVTLLLASILASACAPAPLVLRDNVPPPRDPLPDDSARAAAPSSEEPDLCKRIRADQLKLVKGARGSDQSADDGFPTVFGWCGPTPSGAWAILLQSLEHPGQGNPELVGRWSVAHVTREGKVTAAAAPAIPKCASDAVVAPPDAPNLVFGWDGRVLIGRHGRDDPAQEPQTFDYDGDGEPELFLLVRSTEHEGPTCSRGTIWTMKNGAVLPYSPTAAMAVEGVADIDNDGRPDLQTYGPYRALSGDSPSGFEFFLPGPLLVAHSLADGAFSMADDVAAGAARRECPSKPASFKAAGNESSVARYVVCSRLWGVADKAVAGEVKRVCPKPRNPDDFARRECWGADQVARWTTIAPPVSLK